MSYDLKRIRVRQLSDDLRTYFLNTFYDVIMIQTADPDLYVHILAQSSRTNRLYCKKWKIAYKEYIGIKRGHYPWHATFNRIVMLEQLLESGYRGWVFYLDADAFVHDLDFDVRNLIRHTDASLIASPGGLTGNYWDINAGVFLLNLRTAAGKAIVHLWFDDFMRTPDEELNSAANWSEVPSDQERLHDILRRNPGLSDAALMQVSRELFNDGNASFVRQMLRMGGSLEERRLAIRDQADEIIRRFR